MGRFRTTDVASAAMTVTGLALWTHLGDLDRPGFVTLILAIGSLLAWFAAREVRRADALGWTLTTGHAVITTSLLVVTCGTGLPGIAPSGWRTSTVLAVVTASIALFAGLASLATSYHARRGAHREV